MKKLVIQSFIVMSIGAGCVQAGTCPELNKCAGCHGKSFEKKALGKSKIVANMSEIDIKSALEGYSKGTYGGPMKGMMKMQVKGMTDFNEVAKKVYLTSGHKIENKNIVSTNSMFEKNKETCGKKLQKIQDLYKEAKTPADMKKVKDSILKLAEHIKDLNDMKMLKKLLPGKPGQSCSINQ